MHKTDRPEPAANWFLRPNVKPVNGPFVEIFCLPYAGGNSTIFRGWQDEIPAALRILPIRLPGRLERLADPPIANLQELARALADEIAAKSAGPFALFGISMGALVAFETARRLHAAGTTPQRLIVGSYPGPSLRPSTQAVHELPDEAFLAVLRNIGAAPPGLLGHHEMMQLVLPAVRADFAATETYIYQPGAPLPIPITAVHGIGDRLSVADEMYAWARESTQPLDYIELPGGHFFLHESRPQLLALLTSRLAAAHCDDSSALLRASAIVNEEQRPEHA